MAASGSMLPANLGLNPRQARGAAAEGLAWQYLAAHGYRPICRNVRIGHDELDIIAWCGEVLVFVEVRSRQHERYGSPEQSIGLVKQRRLARAARGYLGRSWRGQWPQQMRFDVVSVVFGPPTVVRLTIAAWVCDG